MWNINVLLRVFVSLTTAGSLFVLLFFDPANFGIFIVFTLITIVSAILPLAFKDKIPPNFQKWFDNILICSFWFIVGFFIFKISTPSENLSKIPNALFFITFGVIVVIFSFSTFLLVIDFGENSKSTVTSVTEFGDKLTDFGKILVSNSSGIRDFNSLLEKIISENPDIVIIAGNLLSMSTNEGANLVNRYLDQDKTNVIKLLIPISSQPYLKLVKGKIASSCLNRLEVFIADPFWFLQGIVILGRRKISHDDCLIDPYGCIFYKIKMTKDDENSKEGIYIDLKDKDAATIKDSFAAYYCLLNSLEYSEGDYKVKNVFTKKNTTTNKNEPFLAKKQIKWETI